MRALVNSLLICVCLVSANALFAEQQESDFNDRHPGDAALFQEEDGTWEFVSFPSGAKLYVFEGDSPGESRCYQGCESAWPPLYVSEDHKTERVGQWTIIQREDGSRQWAYKGQPVYHRFHNLPVDAESNGFKRLKP